MLSPLAAYLACTGAEALAFRLVFTVQAVYCVQELQLTPLHLVLIGTVLEAACFLLEVPTGVIADTYSRKLSVILGCVFLGASFLLIGSVPAFAAQVIAALGYTCLSGALNAWITDETSESTVGALFLRGSQVARVLGILGIIAAALLGSVSLQLPILTGAVIMLALAVLLAVRMPEQNFRREQHGYSLSGMTGTFLHGVRAVRARPLLLTLLLVAALYGASTEAYDRLWEYHLLQSFTFPAWPGMKPVTWFAAIELAGLLLGLLVTGVLRGRVDTAGTTGIARSLATLTAVGMLGALAFAFAGHLWLALAAMWLVDLARGIYGPLYDAWLNQGLGARSRATVLSIAAQADALGQVAGGPALGYLGNVSGVRWALAATALLRLPTLLLFTRGLRAERPNRFAGSD